MKVLFKTDKYIDFIEDETLISSNDFMAHSLMVKSEKVLSRRESLWVNFQSVDYPSIKSNEALMKLEFSKGEEWYVLLIPEEVIRVAGEWEFELRLKRFNTTTEMFELVYASEPAQFTISDGLSGESPTVTNETIGSLYSQAKEAVEMLKEIPKITTDDEIVLHMCGNP